tara:strand:- start:249 stop:1379 length:1131 start_codon:yes stop_codon:yes gene_type:complete
MDKFDVCIAGAGVVGLAIAYQLSRAARHRNKSIVIIEKENSFGKITSSRNSEVIHAGIYYSTDSLKAKLCVTGKHLLYAYLEEFNVPYQKVGKFIVAQEGEEIILQEINVKAIENDVTDLKFIESKNLKKLEPNVKGSAALFSPSTGIIDVHAYMQSLLFLAENSGVTFSPFTEIKAVDFNLGSFKVSSVLNHDNSFENYMFECNQFVNCAGIDAQQLASHIEGVNQNHIPRLHLCKGDYFSYSGPSPFKHLIYPIPEANHTGLGIHSTIDIGGQTRFGPDTTFVEELNYDVDAAKGQRFYQAIQKYFPKIDRAKLNPSYAGIRPKIAGPGEAAADFQIHGADVHGVSGLVQLFGIESPGLTSSLAIGNHVTDLLE